MRQILRSWEDLQRLHKGGRLCWGSEMRGAGGRLVSHPTLYPTRVLDACACLTSFRTPQAWSTYNYALNPAGLESPADHFFNTFGLFDAAASVNWKQGLQTMKVRGESGRAEGGRWGGGQRAQGGPGGTGRAAANVNCAEGMQTMKVR